MGELWHVLEIISNSASDFCLHGRCGRCCRLTNSIYNHSPFLLPASARDWRSSELNIPASLAAGVFMWFCQMSESLLRTSETAFPFADEDRRRGLLPSPSSCHKCRSNACSYNLHIETIRMALTLLGCPWSDTLLYERISFYLIKLLLLRFSVSCSWSIPTGNWIPNRLNDLTEVLQLSYFRARVGIQE